MKIPYKYNLTNPWAPKFLDFFIRPNFHPRRSLFYAIKKYHNYLSGNVLDFGCGTKPYQSVFNCKKYVGLEIFGCLDSKADIYYGGNVIPFDSETFDSFISIQVLYQVPNIDLILNELNRVLKYGSTGIISCPFVWFDSNRSIEARYSHESLAILLKQHKFEILHCTKTIPNLAVPITLINCMMYEKLVSRSSFRRLFLFLASPFIFVANFLTTITLTLARSEPSIYIDAVYVVRKAG